VIESTAADTSPRQIEEMLDAMPGMGQYLYHVMFPGPDRADDAMAAVFEYDGNAAHADGRATLRLPTDNPAAPHRALRDQRWSRVNGLVNVNHYLKRKREIPLLDSSSRYVEIRDGVDAAAADGQVDVDEARVIMAGVGFRPSWLIGRWITLHTTVFEPRGMMLHVFFAAGGRPGFEGDRLDVPFAELFREGSVGGR